MSPKVSADRKEQYQEERRNQIIDAALEVFGNKGLDGATVDDIAEAAGISKGTIYIYFKSKDAIFDAILAERTSLPNIERLINSTKSSKELAEMPLQSLLERAGEEFFSFMDSYYPLLRLILADAHRFPVQAEHVYNNLILKANKLFADFLSAQADAGKIRHLDSPLITSRCFIGMLTIYVMSQEMLGGKKFLPIDHKEWLKETVRIFMEGVQVNDK